jgi:inner membrane protein
MDSAQPPVIPTPGSRRLAVFLKITSICLLIPFLHIPLFMTNGVLRERQGYQAQADKEIAETWGQTQLVTGPVLMVPWSRTGTRTKAITGSDGKIAYEEETFTTIGSLYYLPDVLTANGQIGPEVRYRGIYESIVYAVGLKLTGSFLVEPPKDSLLKTVYYWDSAQLYFGTTDLRRLRAAPKVIWAGNECTVESNGRPEAINLGLVSAVKVGTPGRAVEFSIEMQLQGSGRFEVVPLGKQTQVALSSPWRDPSFTGAYLPSTRSIGPEGFTAKWELGPYGREYPFFWNSRDANTKTLVDKFSGSSLGVVLAKPVSTYSVVERAQKYGVLFFVLVFAVFFLFEVTSPALRIHPLQYAMVGAALCLFFLGFLALSEFWTTGVAYAAAAALCTVLVSLYAWSFLKTGLRTLIIGGGLGATYGYLYFVLKSQDYALVAGTAALFGALALVMFCTRRINWYSLEMNAATAGADR